MLLFSFNSWRTPFFNPYFPLLSLSLPLFFLLSGAVPFLYINIFYFADIYNETTNTYKKIKCFVYLIYIITIFLRYDI